MSEIPTPIDLLKSALEVREYALDVREYVKTLKNKLHAANQRIGELEKLKEKRDNQVLEAAHNIRELTASNAALTKENEKLKQCEAVCHCGELVSKHNGWENHGAVAIVESCPYFEQLSAANAKIEALKGLDSPWPLYSTLQTLCDAANHLLKDHDCDQDGWERIDHALKAGREYVALLTQSQPTDERKET